MSVLANRNEKGEHCIMVRCSCCSEILYAEQWDDGEHVLLCMYTMSHRYTWWDKIRYAWRMLRYGRPFADEMCLVPEDAQALAAWLGTSASQLERAKKARIARKVDELAQAEKARLAEKVSEEKAAVADVLELGRASCAKKTTKKTRRRKK